MKKSKYYILTLGCQMNISDSQRIATKLEDLGYQSAPEKEADLVIINCCSVRQSAVDRVVGKIRNLQKDKKKIFVTGCVLLADRRRFEKKNVLYFPIPDLVKIEKLLKPKSKIKTKKELDYFKILPKKDNTNIAYIPIMTGCNNFCSYCAVPYTRGREVSRPMVDIIKEVKQAIKSGKKEIWLLGQNVNSYAVKIKSNKVKVIDNSEFIKLLRTVDDLPGDFQFNFMSSNPQDLGSQLIKTFAKLKKWPRQLHFAMQSGDDEILKKMNRKCTSAQYLELISKIKNQISKVVITTDIIVGYPGETKKQFQNTVNICKKIGFAKAYIGKYSPRAGTVSAKLKDDVTNEEKKHRWLILDELINQ